MGLFSSLFGSRVNYKELINQGAKIIDVRTPQEFSSGNISGSINVPLQTIHKKIDKIKKLKTPIVLCCASGMRSAQATSILKKHGIEAYNAGSWVRLR